MPGDEPAQGPPSGGRRRDRDPWADTPDRFAKGDQEWAQKWSTKEEEPLDPPAGGYQNEKVTAGRINDAYGDGMRGAGPHLGFGMQLAAGMVFFVGLGVAVDRWLDTSPWGVLVGASLGMVGIVAMVVRLAREAGKGK